MCGCGVSRGSTRSAAISAAIPIGTLMKKIQRQETSSTSQPPRIGPTIGPISIGTPITLITRPMRSGPAACVRIVMPAGMIMPPPSPCSTRKPIRAPMLHAVAQSTEPVTNKAIAVMYNRLVPKRSAAQPVIGITVASASV